MTQKTNNQMKGITLNNIPKHPSLNFLQANIQIDNLTMELHESMMGNTFVEMIYNNSSDENMTRQVIYDINEWLLEVFPHYYSDITQGINDHGDGFIKITTCEPPAYRWKITRDRINDDGSEKGVSGPRNCDDNLKTNGKRFQMYDDDDNCYYEGMIYGDYDGFEPLDDFGMPNAGCTCIKINGEII